MTFKLRFPDYQPTPEELAESRRVFAELRAADLQVDPEAVAERQAREAQERAAVIARHRPAAIKEVNALLTEKYGSLDRVPDYKEPGSEEYETRVDRAAERLGRIEEWDARHAAEVAKGMHKPWRDGLTEVDLEPVNWIQIPGTRNEPPVDYYEYRGQRLLRPIDAGIEDQIRLRRAVINAEHARDHTGFRAEDCEPCELEAEGIEVGIPEGIDVGDPEEWARQQERRLRPYRLLVDGRLRRSLLLDGKRATPRAPQPEPPLLTLSELRSMEPAGYLVQGVIPHQAVGILRARDGMGKTFLALDLALHVAAGLMEWHGRDVDWVNDARVLYFMGEGASGAPKRIEAWLEAHPEADTDELDRDVMIYPGSFNLFTGSGFDRALRWHREIRPDLTVIDTQQTHTAGSDHNSASDMALVGERVRALQRASGGTVLVLAHTGKSDKDTRGSSAIEDDADFVLHVTEWSAPGSMRLDITKMKDGPTGSLTLGVRRIADSLVLVDPGQAPAAEWSSSSAASRVLGALRQLQPTGPATVPQVQAVLDDDGLAQMNRGSTYKVLARLVDSGEVVQTVSGATKRYALAPRADQ